MHKLPQRIMSNSTRRALYHRIRNLSDDRMVRMTATLALLMAVIVIVFVQPPKVYVLEKIKCRRYSDFLVICPTSPSAPALNPVKNTTKTAK